MSGDELHVDEGVCSGLGLEPDENIVPGAGDALSKSSVLHHVLGQQAVRGAGAVEHLHGGAFVAFRHHGQKFQRQQLILFGEKILKINNY
jgi:hypothetical protein